MNEDEKIVDTINSETDLMLEIQNVLGVGTEKTIVTGVS